MTVYKHRQNIHKERQSRRRKGLYIGAFSAGLAILVLFLVFDLLTSSQKILDSDPTVLSAVDRVTETIFDEREFVVTAPAEWVRMKSDYEDSHEVFKYRSDREGDRGRTLEIFLDSLPRNFAFSKVLSVEVANGEIEPGSLSKQCYKYVETEDGQGQIIHDRTIVEFEELEFLCHPSTVLNIVGTIQPKLGNAISLGKANNKNSYYFVYTDHTANPRTDIFENMLTAFRHK